MMDVQAFSLAAPCAQARVAMIMCGENNLGPAFRASVHGQRERTVRPLSELSSNQPVR